jgi:hypothetical protein
MQSLRRSHDGAINYECSECSLDERPAVDHPVAIGAGPATRTSPLSSTLPTGVLFDDFDYSDSTDSRLARRGWTVRSGGGGPGVPGAIWSPAAVTFPRLAGGPVLQLESSTNGFGSGTTQTEVFHQRKFREGTYAARVCFADAPVSGPHGDQLVQAFFSITPLAYDLDPNYSELDFEYLPNGGWSVAVSSLYATSWETYQATPWKAFNTTTADRTSYAGWHDLTIHVADHRINYYVDGQIFAEHGEPYYPETPMSVNFNQWFIADGLLRNPARRTYRLRVDYIYFAKDRVVPPDGVAAQIVDYRAASITHIDTL